MEIIPTAIPEIKIIQPDIFCDERGYFCETFRENALQEAGIHAIFVQDNESCSQRGVLRGLHFQNPPFAQGKLVRAIKGSVLDVAVDIRPQSPTYGKWISVLLSETNKHQLWVPEGFAHGFLALEDNTIFSYKCTNYYNHKSEGSIRWNDPTLNIDWNLGGLVPIVSEKDQQAPLFNGKLKMEN